MFRNIFEKLLFFAYTTGKQIYNKRTYQSFYKKYNLPETFRFNGESIKIYGDGFLYVGQNSYIGSYSTIQIQKDYFVRIGSNCRISHNVRIYTTSSLPDQDFNFRETLQSYSKNVEIGDAVWIGVNVFINPGVKIGNNSIIGANSVVTHDVPDNAIVGGVPAKFIRHKKIHV
jgi:maltose O-acetyltransferase